MTGVFMNWGGKLLRQATLKWALMQNLAKVLNVRVPLIRSVFLLPRVSLCRNLLHLDGHPDEDGPR